MSKYEDYAGLKGLKLPAAMKAVVSTGRGFDNLEIREVPVPEPGPDQLLARVDAAGVCPSILKLVEQGEDHPFINGWDMKEWPVTLGDEGAVTLVKAGENLKDKYSPGERYAIQPAVAVPPVVHRERYRNNAEGMMKCAVGYSLPGHLAQYILIQEEVLKAECLLELPESGLSYFEVSMAEPISCIYSAQERNYHVLKEGPHAPRRLSMGLLKGGVTVVRGAGAMGRMHAELALRFSPAAVIVADYQQERRAKAEKKLAAKASECGCKLMCISPDDLERVLKEVSSEGGADDFILALSVQEEQQKALSLLSSGGVANLFGGLPQGRHILKLDARDVHYREIKVVGSSGGDPSDMTGTLKAIGDGDIDPGNYVAAVGSLENAIDVLKMIKNKEIDGKCILYPHIKPAPLRKVEYWDKQKETGFLEERLN